MALKYDLFLNHKFLPNIVQRHIIPQQGSFFMQNQHEYIKLSLTVILLSSLGFDF